MRHRERIDELSRGKGLIDRIQILTMQILDERERKRCEIGGVPHDRRHALQAGHARCVPSSFAGDDLESPAAELADEQWLNDALGLHRLGKLL
jgi:hypothetical protein